MGLFSKRPLIVEAFQITETTRWDNSDWPNWLHKSWNLEPSEKGAFWCMSYDKGLLFVHTEEGPLKVSYGDWIIQGVHGEIYPCKPDIFIETYEEVK